MHELCGVPSEGFDLLNSYWKPDNQEEVKDYIMSLSNGFIFSGRIKKEKEWKAIFLVKYNDMLLVSYENNNKTEEYKISEIDFKEQINISIIKETEIRLQLETIPTNTKELKFHKIQTKINEIRIIILSKNERYEKIKIQTIKNQIKIKSINNKNITEIENIQSKICKIEGVLEFEKFILKFQMGEKTQIIHFNLDKLLKHDTTYYKIDNKLNGLRKYLCDNLFYSYTSGKF